MRQCTTCGLSKELTEYHVDRTNREGRRIVCKVCVRAKSRAHYYANHADRLAYQKTYYAGHKDWAAKYGKAHYQANKAAYKANADAWRKAHPEEDRAARREWVKKNPELRKHIAKACSHKRRAQKRGSAVIDNITLSQWLLRKSVFGDCCAYCGIPEDAVGSLSADHVIPLSRGGLHILSNLRPACKSCNSQKWAKKPSEWSKKRNVLSR